METNYLIHYGVKRRSGRYPWGSGERPYQSSSKSEERAINKAYKGKERSKERFIDSHTIPAGTTMYRSTPSSKEDLKGPKYVTYLDVDRDLYRGVYSDRLKTNSGKRETDSIYENTYVLKEDLKIPSREELKAVQLKAMENPALRKEVVSGIINAMLKEREQDYKEGYGDEWDKTMKKDGEAYIKRYMDIYDGMSPDIIFPTASSGMGVTKNYKATVINELKKKGYNAMVDETGVGGKNNGLREGVEPIIIFDGDKNLSKVSTKEISNDVKDKATKDYMDWYSKANRNRKPGKW